MYHGFAQTIVNMPLGKIEYGYDINPDSADSNWQVFLQSASGPCTDVECFFEKNNGDETQCRSIVVAFVSL